MNDETERSVALSTEDDRLLIDALIANDHATWERMLSSVARPLVETRKYREMTARFGLTVEDVLAQLCEELYRNDFARLRSFRYDGSFSAWLFWEVKNAFRNLIRRSVAAREDAVDPTEEFAFGDALVTTPDPAVDTLHETRTMFVRLWRENPVGAYALLLKGELGVESELLAVFLGKTPNTVDKIVSRAREKMREWRQISERTGS